MYAFGITLGVLGSILVLTRFRVPLAAAILSGSAAAGLLLGLDAPALAKAAWAGVSAPRTLALAAVTVLLTALSVLLQQSGQMDRIVSLAQAVLRRPVVTMMAMPALVGLLPMPGGAIFSAPMVKAAGGHAEVPPGLLSAINYWFRHIWEYFWPLYPGVILAMALTKREIPSWTGLMIFGTAAMFLGGLWMLRGTHPDLHVAGAAPPIGTKRNLLRATSSIWLILLLWTTAYLPAKAWLGGYPAESLPGAALRHGPLLIGLLGSILWTLRLSGLGAADVRRAFLQPAAFSLAGLVFTIMVFQNTLEAAGAPQRIARELQAMHLPPVLMVAILPFLAGFVTGVAVGFVGTTFPIVLNLLGTGQTDAPLWAYIPLAYGFGHLGQMVSPLHVCQILSNQYFGTTYGPVYRYILPAAALTTAMNIGYFLLLRWLG